MKKFFISFVLAFMAIVGNAQIVYISSYSGTDMAKFDGQVKDIHVNREMFQGWNTVSFPFTMTESELNEYFGSDCRLEKLSSVNQNGSTIILNFMDVKSQGIMPNTPYILYFNGETQQVNILLKSVRLENGASQVSFTTNSGATVSMNGANMETEGMGLYGIRAIDNKESKFVVVDEEGPVFYATRCYVQVAGAEGAKLMTTHNEAGTAGIQGVNAADKDNEIVYNLAGQRTSKNAKGVKIINGKKTL